VYEEHQEVLCQ